MDANYDRRRAAEEHARADAATDPAAERSHRQLAALFEQRAADRDGARVQDEEAVSQQ